MGVKQYVCRDCGVVDPEVFTEEHPPHVGLYCSECGAWIKWGSAKEIRLIKFKKEKASGNKG